MDVEECSRCKGSGEIARRNKSPFSFVAAGPVPEDARGVTAETCDVCRGTCYVECEDKP
jgi:DnaJ-class molecular chaperone